MRPAARTFAIVVVAAFIAGFVAVVLAITSDHQDDKTVWARLTFALIAGPLSGSVFLHIGLSFPSGRLAPRLDRALAIAGYVIVPLASVPALLFAGPEEIGCDDCPTNLLLIRRDEDLANAALALAALLYAALFVIVLVRSVRHSRASPSLLRLQLTPVYICALGTFLLVTIARAGGGDAAWLAAFISTD
jgi:hypothetical protein